MPPQARLRLPPVDAEALLERRLNQADRLVHIGEVSRARQALTAAEYLLTVDPDFLIPLTPQQKRELLYQFERGTVMI